MNTSLPRIIYFLWHPYENGVDEFMWSVVNSDETKINNLIVQNNGTLIVNSLKDTEWKIEAKNKLGFSQKIIYTPKKAKYSSPRIKSFKSNEINVYAGDKISIHSEVLNFKKLMIRKKIYNNEWEDVFVIDEGEQGERIGFRITQEIKNQTEFWLNINDTKEVGGNQLLNINLIEPLKLHNGNEQDNFIQIIERIKDLIGKAKLTKAFELLMSISAMIKGIEEEVYTLNFRKSLIERDFMLGLITYEEHKVENTRIVLAVLKLIQEI